MPKLFSFEIYIWVILVATLVALLATPFIRLLAIKLGVVDRPKERGVHEKPVPLLGGVSIFLAFLVTVLFFGDLTDHAVQGLLLGGLVILVVGVVDDIRSLSPKAKMLGILLAAAIAVAFGVRIEWVTNPFGGMFNLGWLGIPLTVIWIISVTNIVNLIDGLDGLAAGIVAIVGITMLFSGVRTDQPVIALILIAALIGSSLGFLPYNFNPAKIFMGDAGALFLGYSLGVISVIGTLKGVTTIALAVPVLTLGLPIADTIFAIIRRMQNGQPISTADKGHIHHRLLQLGLSHRDTVLVMYLITGWLGISALVLTQVSMSQAAVILAFVTVSLLYIGRKLGVLNLKSDKKVNTEN